MKKKENISITLDREIITQIKALSEEESISVSAFIRRLLLREIRGRSNDKKTNILSI